MRKHLIHQSKRDPTKSKSKLHWTIVAEQTLVRELCMTPRQYRMYADDLKSSIEPNGFRSQLMQYHIPIWSPRLKRKMEPKKT